MVYLVVGIEKTTGDDNEVASKLKAVVSGLGDVLPVALENKKFHVGNADNRYMSYEESNKLEHGCEQLIKRIEKAFIDIDPKNKLENMKVESKQGSNETIEDFLSKFTWDEAKYPRSQDVNAVLNNLASRVKKAENNLRNKQQQFNEAKQAKLNAEKGKGGLVSSRDFNEILVANNQIKATDFIYHCEHLSGDGRNESVEFTNMIAFVENSKVKEFENHYERWNNYIVPQSAKKLPTTGADFASWSIYVFHALAREATQVIKAARDQSKIVVKEFSRYDREYLDGLKGGNNAISNFQGHENALRDTCTSCFKEIYSVFIHIKVTKVVIDSMMRFSAPDRFKVHMVRANKGKEKKLCQNMVRIFSESGKEDMYGFKEDNGDEDYFPFAYADVKIPFM